MSKALVLHKGEKIRRERVGGMRMALAHFSHRVHQLFATSEFDDRGRIGAAAKGSDGIANNERVINKKFKSLIDLIEIYFRNYEQIAQAHKSSVIISMM